MVKAVIFDMFETLVSLYRCEQYFGEHMCRDMGIAEERFREIWDADEGERSIGVKRLEDTVREIMEKNGVFEQDLFESIVRKRSEGRRKVFDVYRDDIKPMLTALKARGIKVALITNCFSEEAVAIKDSDLYPLFDVPILSYDEGFMKPDPAIYRLALDRLGLQPEECLYVGDGGSHELEAARDIGMKPLQALWYLKENTRSKRGHNPEFVGLEEPADVLKYL